MSDLPMPRPWRERADDDLLLPPAPLLPPERMQPSAPPPAMVNIGSGLARAIEKLGSREVSCDVHGAYTSHGTRLGVEHKREYWTGCQACVVDRLEATEQERINTEAAARVERISEALQRSALPERFVGRTFDNYVAATLEQEAALAIARGFAEKFDSHRRRGSVLIFAGNPGTGKSHLASAILQHGMPAVQGLYTTLPGLIRMVRDTWRRDSVRTETEVMADMARLDLLAIDEIGVQYGTDGEKNILFEVMDRRYMDRRPTILMTNLDREAFREYVGDRVYDRLVEVCRWVPFTWKSYRSTLRKEGA
jgi:DNA replication protein DnaC